MTAKSQAARLVESAADLLNNQEVAPRLPLLIESPWCSLALAAEVAAPGLQTVRVVLLTPLGRGVDWSALLLWLMLGGRSWPVPLNRRGRGQVTGLPVGAVQVRALALTRTARVPLAERVVFHLADERIRAVARRRADGYEVVFATRAPECARARIGVAFRSGERVTLRDDVLTLTPDGEGGWRGVWRTPLPTEAVEVLFHVVTPTPEVLLKE